MTRDEWNQVLVTEHATFTQVGAIIDEFGRLDGGQADRLDPQMLDAFARVDGFR